MHEGVYASVQLFLTIGQFAKMHPNLRFYCVDYECVVPDEEADISVADILRKVCPPTKIAIFDKRTSTFEEIGIRVRCLSLCQLHMFTV